MHAAGDLFNHLTILVQMKLLTILKKVHNSSADESVDNSKEALNSSTDAA